MNVKRSFFLILILTSSLVAAPAGAKPGGAVNRTAEGVTKVAAVLPTTDVHTGTKVVQYGERDVVQIKTKLRYTTLIVLPKNEQLLDFTCGDKEIWVVSGNENFAHVKPAKVGAQTNLNLITASGNVYSFVLSEISENPKAEPDLKVFVELKEESMISAATAQPRFVSAQELAAYKDQADMAKEEARKVKQATEAAIDSGISKFLANVRFPFRFEAGKKPFWVRAMYHDDKFTYIRARPEETPTLYELKDGQPNVVNFDYKNGLYVVDKILDEGYLAIGKQKLRFKRQE